MSKSYIELLYEKKVLLISVHVNNTCSKFYNLSTYFQKFYKIKNTQNKRQKSLIVQILTQNLMLDRTQF